MKMLMILVLATAAVVVSGQSQGQCDIDNPMFMDVFKCKKILMPPHEVMNPMKASMRTCFGMYGLTELSRHRVLEHVSTGCNNEIESEEEMNNNIMGDQHDPRHMLCFLSKFQKLSVELQRNVSMCCFHQHGLMDGNVFNVEKIMAHVEGMISEAPESPPKQYLLDGLSKCPKPSDEPNLTNLARFKKCLMGSCIKGSIEMANPVLKTQCK